MSDASFLRDGGAHHRSLTAQLADLLRRAPDVEAALRLLTGYQARRPTRGAWAREFAAPCSTRCRSRATCCGRHEIDGAVVWVGPVKRH